MKGFAGITNNDWFAFLFTAATFTKNSPQLRHKKGEQARHKAGGQA
jgi:hypothetical protein